MAASNLHMQSSDGSIVTLQVADGLCTGTRKIATGPSLSGVTAYHLLQGDLSVSNEVITNGFSTTLYTGNGTTQSINTGVDMATQWGGDASETFGGLVWLKGRSDASSNYFIDSVRGVTKQILSDSTSVEQNDGTKITSFNTNGFSLGSNVITNLNSATKSSWNFQTTHRRTGTTNHGKAYTEHYNPFTGFTIIKYEGSGLAGHEIPHSLGRKLGLYTIKNLSAASDWFVKYMDGFNYLYLNNTSSQTIDNNVYSGIGDEYKIPLYTVHSLYNTSPNQYIMYGWANSYLDESNKLIGNYEIGVYQGTGASGNKVTTRGKPAWIMTKRLDSTGDWIVFDNLRTPFGTNRLFPNSTSAEVTTTSILTGLSDGFSLNTADAVINASGGQYLYMVVYDNDSGSGKSKYPKATDTSNVQINNALIPLAHGVDSNGSKNSIVIANETITGLTYTAGKNYLYKTDTDYGVKPYEPRYLKSDLIAEVAGDNPDYFDVTKNTWYNTLANPELVANGTFTDGTTTGWTVGNSASLSVLNNTIKVMYNGVAFPSAYQLISTVVGKKYTLIVTANAGNANPVVNVSSTLSIGDIYTSGAISGKKVITFIAKTSTTYVELVTATSTAGEYAYFDNISVYATDLVINTEITPRNYLNHIVHADQNGQVTYVEELPKIEYKDVIKANEYRGKNALIAYALVDMTTTPPTIKSSFNVSGCIRISSGVGNLYLSTPTDTAMVSAICGSSAGGTVTAVSNSMITFATGTTNYALTNIYVFGGQQ